jgi:hypothetical protein
MMPEALLLVEILTPSSAADTWSNIPLYATVPTVEEILIVHSTAVQAELLRRRPDGTWPKNPDVISGIDAAIRLASIAMDLAMREVCRSTYLAADS